MQALLDFDKDIFISRSEQQALTTPLWTEKEQEGQLLRSAVSYEEGDDTNEHSGEESEQEPNTK